MSEQCWAYTKQGWLHIRCSNPGKEQAESGRWYCGVHAPSTVERRRANREARYDAEMKAAQARRAELQRTPHTCRTCGLEHRP